MCDRELFTFILLPCNFSKNFPTEHTLSLAISLSVSTITNTAKLFKLTCSNLQIKKRLLKIVKELPFTFVVSFSDRSRLLSVDRIRRHHVLFPTCVHPKGSCRVSNADPGAPSNLQAKFCTQDPIWPHIS